jgi:hypothetical protein
MSYRLISERNEEDCKRDDEMKRKTILNLRVVILFLMLFQLVPLGESTYTYQVIAGSSSSSEGASPSGGGGGGSGERYYNYYPTLLFRSSTGKHSVVQMIAAFDQTVVFLNFTTLSPGLDSTLIMSAGETVTIDPDKELNLKNGTLFQANSPIQLVIVEVTVDLTEDNSFGCSFLPINMWGYYHVAPSDALASIVSGANDTYFWHMKNGEIIKEYFSEDLGETDSFDVKKGDVIVSDRPIQVVFYHEPEPSNELNYALEGIPKYLWNRNYSLFTTPLPPVTEAQEFSYLTIFTAEEPAIVTLSLESNLPVTIKIKAYSSANLPVIYENQRITSVSSSKPINLVLFFSIQKGLSMHGSAVSLLPLESMKAAELFMSPGNPSIIDTRTVIFHDNTSLMKYYPIGGQFVQAYKTPILKSKGEKLLFSDSLPYLVFTNKSVFFYSSYPSINTNYTSPSIAFVLYPLNSYSYFSNETTPPSWYRFPNLALAQIKQSPDKIEELSNFRLEILIINNGTIPSSNFRASVSYNQTTEAAIDIIYLDVNETIIFTFDQFRWIGTKQFELEIAVDTADSVSETSEADNKITYFIIVNKNYRFRGALIAVAGLIVIIISKRYISRIQNTRSRNHIHYDVIV